MQQRELNESQFGQSHTNATSLGVLAADDLANEIRLTKFCALPQGSSHTIDIDNQEQETTKIGANLAQFALAEMGKTHKHHQHAGSQLIQDLALEVKQQILMSDQNESKQFQLVWRQLSFQIEASAYERLMNSTFDRINSLARPSCWSAADTGADKTQPRRNTSDNYNISRSTCELAHSFQSDESLPQRAPLGAQQRRIVFQNLSGYIRSGEISAILGPSGAGKTSLLNAICGGKLEGYRGTVELVTEPGVDQKQCMQMSIIPQKDYLIENLTVRENLLYSSQLLNHEPDFNHELNIMRVVRMLNLSRCLDASAGAISGGEYKRVSIAQELLRQPDILILDEPTSGLDSLNCKKLIKSLKQLIEASKAGALKPMAVVMTIHQPDIEVFNLFDHVYCMARRGRVVYDGHPSDAMRTIRTHAGFTPDTAPAELEPDAHVNPANFLIELASEDIFGEAPIEQLACFQRKQFDKMFNGPAPADDDSPKSSTLSGNLEQVSQETSALKSLKRDKRLQPKHNHEGKFWYHTKVLARRAFVSMLRDPLLTLVSFLFHLSIPFVMWAIYPRSVGRVTACPVILRELDMVTMASNKTLEKMGQLQADLNASFGCSTMLFITVYALSMCALAVAALAFPLSMHILIKEVRNGWYELKTFVLAKQIASFPFEAIFPTMTMMMIYIMLDMPTSPYEWRLWSIALVMAVIAMISNTHGLIIGALFMDNMQTTVFLSIASTLPEVLLSGFTSRIKWMPEILQKLSWISQYRYANELINGIRFGFGLCPCDDETDKYLRNNPPRFRDIPANIKPMFLYYLSISDGDDANSTNKTQLPDTTLATQSNDTLALAGNFTASHNISGIEHSFMLDSIDRKALLSKMESEEVDIFAQMAEMMSRSLAFGHEITSCKSVRSQLLIETEGQQEEMFFIMVYCLLALLAVSKLILFFTVRWQVGNRV